MLTATSLVRVCVAQTVIASIRLHVFVLYILLLPPLLHFPTYFRQLFHGGENGRGKFEQKV